MVMDPNDRYKVLEIKALKRPGHDEALKFLHKIAKQVQPIMRKRKWTVNLLSEFDHQALLGLNVGGGAQIKLRLRRTNRDWDFFPDHEVLDTMLHELCHIEHGPHNAPFYKLWDELRLECDELMAKGITGTGQGFDLQGRRLGGFSRQPPLSSLRQTALAAAEKRARVGALLPSGPKRLGGDSYIMAALSPIQAAAMAAERRLQDDMWCGSVSCGISSAVGSDSGVSGQPEFVGSSKDFTVSKTDAKEVIILDDDSGFGDSCNSKISSDNLLVRSLKDGSNSNSKVGSSSASTLGLILNHSAQNNRKDKATWECSVCTLLNEPLAPICEACGTEKPKDVATKFKIWSCKFCTLENDIKLDKCSACGQWRYSYGPPISTRGPYLGT
ncbi:hypothetical protein AAC387_Pa03g0199 [Persea americana]